MHPLMAMPTVCWIACPGTQQQTDAFWQAVGPLRPLGIELVLRPLGDELDLPWDQLEQGAPWQGLVLWPDEQGKLLRLKADQRGVQVRRLVASPVPGLQAWSGA
jgi:hypothetical protein